MGVGHREGGSGGARLVRDAMRSDVLGVVPEMTIPELVQVFLENSISGAPVLDSRGKAIGVVSTTDVMRLAAGASDDRRVRDIMTPVTFTVRPGDTLSHAVRFMLRGRIHRALVVEDGMLHGIITPFDVLEAVDWE